MSAPVTDPAVQVESKQAKKKRGKHETSGKASSVGSATPTPSAGGETTVENTPTEGTNGSPGKDDESPYMRELHR